MKNILFYAKKHFFVGLFGLVIIILGVNQFQLNNQLSHHTTNKVLSFEDTDTQEILKESSEGNETGEGIVFADLHIPHLSCHDQTIYSDLPVSDIYNENTIYDHAFMGNGTNFQDLNGDGLADYTFTTHQNYVSGDVYSAEHKSCTYLNDGNGWARAYICYAKTRSYFSTGQPFEREYRGDCADTSNNKEN